MTIVASTLSGAQGEFSEIVGDGLADVIQSIEKGNIVALFTDKILGETQHPPEHANLSKTMLQRVFKVFHNLGKIKIQETCVTYFDCKERPGVLENGGWEAAIREKIPTVSALGYGKVRAIIISNQAPLQERYCFIKI